MPSRPTMLKQLALVDVKDDVVPASIAVAAVRLADDVICSSPRVDDEV